MTDSSRAPDPRDSSRAIVTSADGQWAAIRIGRSLSVVDRPATEDPPPAASIELASEDVDLAIVMPGGVIVVERTPSPRVLLLSLPELEPVAAIELEAAYHIRALTGSRIVLGGTGPHHVIVRVASRALAAQGCEPGIADFVAGMDKHQIVFGLAKKLEVWDAVSARPLIRMQLQLPPPPRVVGSALGHLFVTRPGSDEVYVYRLSDGRPFRHQAGSKVERAIGHPASGIVVLVTPRGLVRINCFAHSLTMIDSPYVPGTALAIHGTGDAVTLLGVSPAGEAWRVSLEVTHPAPSTPVTLPPAAPPASSLRAPAPPPVAAWRPNLVEAARAIVRGESAGLGLGDCELTQLAARLGLGGTAQRALTALYALYLIGETASIARLAETIDDWTEPLGQGELAQLALIRRLPDGRVRLRHVVANLLDGAAPHAVRLAGAAPASSRHGAFKLVRRGRTDAAIEAALITQVGRIAVIEGDVAGGLLEARLHDAVALAHVAPALRPTPWPRDASAVIVVDDASPRWVTELPAYDAG